MASRKTSEIAKLQDEIAGEIAGDAPEIAMMVFGAPRDQPDVVTVRNERLDDVYRQAYLRNDRPWLQGEAKRNPEQFLKVADRIGVKLPPPGVEPLKDGAFAKTAMQVAQPLPPPIAPPIMQPPPQVMPMQAVPQAPAVLLGPNGQPLPPSVPPQVM